MGGVSRSAAEQHQTKGEWEGRLAVADAMVDFLEGWVVRDLCVRFRTVAESVYSDTFEHQLLSVLLENPSPQSLQDIARKCGVSRTLGAPRWAFTKGVREDGEVRYRVKNRAHGSAALRAESREPDLPAAAEDVRETKDYGRPGCIKPSGNFRLIFPRVTE